MLDDTLEAMRAAALGSTDAGGYFPAMYARVTRRVIDDAAAGRFADNARMATFVVGVRRPLPRCPCRPVVGGEVLAWELRRGRAILRCSIVQHLLLGINAHVNFDLPQTVVGLVDGGAELDAIRPDFEAVNNILADDVRRHHR